MTHTVLVQKPVEMAFLVVMTFADVRRDVHVPVGLPGVTGKTLPAQVILECNATQRSCYRLGRVAITTWSNALRVSEYQQQEFNNKNHPRTQFNVPFNT